MPRKATDKVSDDLEKSKLREEVQTLKLQRLIAVLSAIGVVLAFLVTNYTTVIDIFYPAPKIQLVVEDPYLQQVGTVSIKSNLTEDGATVVKTSVAAARDWIPMQAGSYRLQIGADDQTFFQTDILLKAGDRERYVIPASRDERIHVTVYNDSPRPLPGQSVKLRIESSGNGYLWVYFLPPGGDPALVYPPVASIGTARHAIGVATAFNIPDAEGNAILASESPAEEDLLVIVTSSSGRTTADAIAKRMSASGIAKASAGTINENWGVTRLQYKVGL